MAYEFPQREFAMDQQVKTSCCCSGDPSYQYGIDYAIPKCRNWPPNPVKTFSDDVDRLYSTRSIWKCGAWYWSWPPFGAGPQTYNITPQPDKIRKNYENKFMFGSLGDSYTPS